jgi:hypothetical protein
MTFCLTVFGDCEAVRWSSQECNVNSEGLNASPPLSVVAYHGHLIQVFIKCAMTSFVIDASSCRLRRLRIRERK